LKTGQNKLSYYFMGNFLAKKITLPFSDSFLKGSFIFIFALLFFGWLQANYTLPDPDSFYHAKMAVLMRDSGIVKDFPWLQATTLKDSFTDHHLFYHFLLIPFVSLFDPLIGIKISQVIFASLAVFLIYRLLAGYGIKNAFLYPFLLLTSASFISRLSLPKANGLSLIILILALYLLFKRKSFLLFLISILYVWTYGGWPILLVIAGAFLLSETFFSFKSGLKSFLILFFKNAFRKDNLMLISSILIGIIVGLVASPYFPQNLSFYWVQVFKIGLINLQNTIGVGGEWYPSHSFTLVPGTFLIFFLWLFSIGWFFIKKQGQNVRSLTLLLLSLLFFLFTLKSQRYVEYFAPLAVLGTAFSLDSFWKEADWQGYWQKIKGLFIPPYHILSFFISFYAIILTFVFIQYNLNKIISVKETFEDGRPLSHLRGSADFLKQNTPAGTIVFHSVWDESPELFYYNDKNYYINGLDQTFMYLYSPDLYRSWENITEGKIKDKEMALAIKDGFGAPYVLVTKRDGLEQMRENLGKSSYFEKIYEDSEALIYKINPIK
jgi:hypothetical protein